MSSSRTTTQLCRAGSTVRSDARKNGTFPSGSITRNSRMAADSTLTPPPSPKNAASVREVISKPAAAVCGVDSRCDAQPDVRQYSALAHADSSPSRGKPMMLTLRTRALGLAALIALGWGVAAADPPAQPGKGGPAP